MNNVLLVTVLHRRYDLHKRGEEFSSTSAAVCSTVMKDVVEEDMRSTLKTQVAFNTLRERFPLCRASLNRVIQHFNSGIEKLHNYSTLVHMWFLHLH